MSILVTGGAGYIGSHTVRQLLAAGHSVVVYDNLSKGHQAAVDPGAVFVEGDIFDQKKLTQVLRQHKVEAVVHFAAYSLVGESMQQPQRYYHNNVQGTLTLLDVMLAEGVNKLVFSSTAAVYGEPACVPITEDSETKPTNVYGRTKLVMEQAMADYAQACGLRYIALRYFNACGADPAGDIGEDHSPETHLLPIVLQTCLGQREAISVFGDDYDTKDGTCVRDYIHVNDLAAAHVLAVEALQRGADSSVYNLGVGNGFTVQEIIDAAEAVTGRTIRREMAPRRAGDPAVLIASSAKIRQELGWEPRYTEMRDIIATAWRWHEQHPQGYRS